jgi:hypothetical protein
MARKRSPDVAIVIWEILFMVGDGRRLVGCHSFSTAARRIVGPFLEDRGFGMDFMDDQLYDPEGRVRLFFIDRATAKFRFICLRGPAR